MSNFSVNGGAHDGDLTVVITNEGGHSVDTLAVLCTNKLMYVSPTAPDEVRLQAEAFKDTIRNVVRGYLLQAKKSERTTIIAELQKNGYDDAAKIIGAL